MISASVMKGLNPENFAQNFVRLALHFLRATFCFNEREIFSTQST